MERELNYNFSIYRFETSGDPDFASSIKIYNETTPYEIKTNTNEIVFWLDKKDYKCSFEPMYFGLYYSGKLSGFAMMTYIKSQRIVILEYIALETQYRVNTVFFTYINLLESYLNVNQYDVSFIINEVSNRNNGSDIDKESQIFSKLLCIDGYGKIDAPYMTAPLGTNNFESSFDAFLFVKSAGDVHNIDSKTYIAIVRAIYFEYFQVWYEDLLTQDEFIKYKQLINKCFDNIYQNIDMQGSVPVLYTECPILLNNSHNIKTVGIPPTIPKKSKFLLYSLLAIVVVTCPLLIIFLYNVALDFLHISIGSVSSVIGSCLGSSITAIVTFVLAKRQL